MKRAYICAPFWHPSPVIRRWNVDRALLLARLAAAEGFEPVCVHGYLWDTGADDDADPDAREAGIERGCATVREIAAEGGVLWGLTLDSLRLSDGCLIERGAWLAERPTEYGEQWSTSWHGWRLRMEAAGLGEAWAALAVPPC